MRRFELAMAVAHASIRLRNALADLTTQETSTLQAKIRPLYIETEKEARIQLRLALQHGLDELDTLSVVDAIMADLVDAANKAER
jgi:hypothetical protein